MNKETEGGQEAARHLTLSPKVGPLDPRVTWE